jgi:2'-5' RNA ligase
VRLFTAIELDEAARVAIAAKQAHLREAFGDRSMKWVSAERMHLTLVFIGQVADQRVPRFIEVMEERVEQPPFRLVFGGTGMFPPHGAPRVLWMGVRDGARQAIELHRQVATRLEELGVPRDGRPFAPHLTLARWRESRFSDRRRLPADEGAVVAAIEVAAVTLFESRISSSGPTYTPLAQAMLGSC